MWSMIQVWSDGSSYLMRRKQDNANKNFITKMTSARPCEIRQPRIFWSQIWGYFCIFVSSLSKYHLFFDKVSVSLMKTCKITSSFEFPEPFFIRQFNWWIMCLYEIPLSLEGFYQFFWIGPYVCLIESSIQKCFLWINFIVLLTMPRRTWQNIRYLIDVLCHFKSICSLN